MDIFAINSDHVNDKPSLVAITVDTSDPVGVWEIEIPVTTPSIVSSSSTSSSGIFWP